MQRKRTIAIDAQVYDALHRQIGRRNISAFIEGLVRERLVRSRVYTDAELEAGYREMAADEEAECEALQWCEALIGDTAV